MRQSLRGLVWRLFVAASMVAITIGLASMVSETLRGTSLWDLLQEVRAGGPDANAVSLWHADYGPGIAGVAAAWCVASGAMLSAGLGHVRRRWVVWGALVGAVAGVMLFDGAMDYVRHASRMLPRHDDHGPQMWTYFDMFRRLGSWMLPGLAIALLGIPLGRSLRRALAKQVRQGWIKKLARARKRRYAT